MKKERKYNIFVDIRWVDPDSLARIALDRSLRKMAGYTRDTDGVYYFRLTHPHKLDHFERVGHLLDDMGFKHTIVRERIGCQK